MGARYQARVTMNLRTLKHCHGDGMDPWNDYLLPCPLCQGEG